MKRIWLVLVTILMLTAGTAGAYNPYAPNQFDTMERNTWEYQYVYELSKDGLTDADMSKFSSSYNLTRFEMAQMVAAAMEHRSQATPDQQKKIDRLAADFADDLQYAGGVAAEPDNQSGGQMLDWKQGEGK